ncbi:uncharacterized protein E5676_scaffold287G00470 [Cucumis melo var. makuwa]|uniref:Uncharacterized protein n=1 Tax=Cucumis melo var. makuwa TaxID=1194695 RepID=A0A5D3C4D7_CUCMM|nr:uncharacterized protein E5676_scaffold287G00470 [Cucumis melo var. makuwa]
MSLPNYSSHSYKVTPYLLVYGVEVVLFLEREISSLRIAVQEGLTTEDNVKLHLQMLEALDEKQLGAQQAIECDDGALNPYLSKRTMVQLQEDDDGEAPPLPLQEENEDEDDVALPSPLQDEDGIVSSLQNDGRAEKMCMIVLTRSEI